MKVWVDMDGGFDDLWAVLTLRSLGVQIDGMSLVAGNTTLHRICLNAAAAAAAFGWEFPIHMGCERPLHGMSVTSEHVLGPTAIRTRGHMLPECPDDRIGDSALDAMCNWLSDGRTERTILALGPLTNLASVALARPDALQAIGSIVWMGGSVGDGNHTPFAEFNAFADPEAVAVLLSQEMPIHVVDLNLCRSIRFSASDIDRIAGSCGRNAGLLADLAAGYLSIAEERSRSTMAIYDPVAATALTAPRLFGFREAKVEMVMTGRERGQTVVDFTAASSACNAMFAITANVPEVRRVCLDALLWEANR